MDGEWIAPARTYALRLPGPIPAKDFWSVVVYDLWTRSMLANGQAHASVGTYSPGVEADPDGGMTLYRTGGPSRKGGQLDPRRRNGHLLPALSEPLSLR